MRQTVYTCLLLRYSTNWLTGRGRFTIYCTYILLRHSHVIIIIYYYAIHIHIHSKSKIDVIWTVCSHKQGKTNLNRNSLWLLLFLLLSFLMTRACVVIFVYRDACTCVHVHVHVYMYTGSVHVSVNGNMIATNSCLEVGYYNYVLHFRMGCEFRSFTIYMRDTSMTE